MITAEKVTQEMKTGLAAVCAWCEHYHNNKERGPTVSCGQTDCGGPAAGKGFPKYKGFMERKLHSFCFICGKEPEAGFDIGGKMLGVCNKKHPDGETCMGKLKDILARQSVVVHEQVVPVIGDKEDG